MCHFGDVSEPAARLNCAGGDKHKRVQMVHASGPVHNNRTVRKGSSQALL